MRRAIASLSLMTIALPAVGAEPAVPYPEGYRDWHFEGFGGGERANRVVRDNAAGACFGCHAPQKDHDYVFSRLRD